MEVVAAPIGETNALGGGDDSDVEDDYSHESQRLIYTASNIPGPGADLEAFEVQYVGCDCDPKFQCGEMCSCVLKSGGHNYDETGLLVDSRLVSSLTPIFECNSQCSCSKENCGNRTVQKGPRKNLAVFQTEAKGKGLRTLREIKKGSFVCEYAGEVIGLEEAKARASKQSDVNYIYTTKEHYGTDKQILTIIDPTVIGNVGRYINHSCNPNLFPVLVRHNNPIPKLSLFTSQDILSGEELTFDYGDGEKAPTGYVGAVALRPCKCNSQFCRKYLPFDQSLF